MAAQIAKATLNYRNIVTDLKINDLVFIPDLLVRKDAHSLRKIIGKIVATSGQEFSIKLIKGHLITRNVAHIIKLNYTEDQNVDILTIPQWQPEAASLPLESSFQADFDKIPSDSLQFHDDFYTDKFEELTNIEEPVIYNKKHTNTPERAQPVHTTHKSDKSILCLDPPSGPRRNPIRKNRCKNPVYK